MSKVILFSTKFPKGHPRQGEETFFVHKIWKSIDVSLPVSEHHKIDSQFSNFLEIEVHKLFAIYDKIYPKHHTMRRGHRFKKGDRFSPRIWSGKPYQSRQIIIADDIEVKQTFDFEMDENGVMSINGHYINNESIDKLARNDGLTEVDMYHWFMPNKKKPKSFDGQIICWNDSVFYDDNNNNDF